MKTMSKYSITSVAKSNQNESKSEIICKKRGFNGGGDSEFISFTWGQVILYNGGLFNFYATIFIALANETAYSGDVLCF